MKKTRNPALTLHILEMVLTQYLLPECTWDCVEECVGWCHEVVVDPAPQKDWAGVDEASSRDEDLVRGPLR